MAEEFDQEEIKRLRRQANITQTELAKRAGVSQSLIARIEAGTLDPRLSTFKKILDALKQVQVEKKRKVEELMSSPVIYVGPDDTVVKVARLMQKNAISQLPVLDKGVQVGSVSETIIINRIATEGDPTRLVNLKVGEIMEDPFPTVSKTANLDVAVSLLRSSPAVLVVDKGRAVGIIAKADAIKLLR